MKRKRKGPMLITKVLFFDARSLSVPDMYSVFSMVALGEVMPDPPNSKLQKKYICGIIRGE